MVRAAGRGDAGAQFVLGLRYHNGAGVPRDHAEAARWLRLAAEQGHAAGPVPRPAPYRARRGKARLFAQAQVREWPCNAISRLGRLWGGLNPVEAP